MRESIHRLTAPLIARLPDVSSKPPARQAAIGLTASLAFHALLFLFLIIGAYFAPVERIEPLTDRNSDQLELVLQPSLEPAPPPEPRGKPIIESRGLAESKIKPANPTFEADQDMVAGSERPPDGLAPLPSQDGKNLPFMDFDTAKGSLGEGKTAADAPKADAPPSQPPPKPLFLPNPVAPDQLAAAEKAPTTAPIPAPAATPPPQKLASTASTSEDLKFPKPAATPPVTRLEPAPAVEPTPRAAATPAPRSQVVMLTTPPPLANTSSSRRFQQSLDKTKIEGSISNRGKPAVDAVATPLGRYKRNMSLRIWSIWKHNLESAPDLLTLGTVTVRYYVHPDGRISNIQVVDDSGDRRHADICLRTLQQTKLEPLPEDAVPLLKNGRLEVPFSFTLY